MRELFERRVVCVLGLPIDVIAMPATVERVRAAVRRRTPLFLSTPNLNFAINGLRDPAFRDSVINSDLSVADGMPLVWVARLLGLPIRERVPGSGLLECLRDGGPLDQVSVYFFGGPEGVAQAAAERLDAQPSGLVCKGWESPGFGTIEALSRPESLARINSSGADFLVVALGAQKGQAWIERNRAQLAIPVVSHLGAALNFVAGSMRRAPRWVQRTGLEWVWRIKEEPALWRRYFRDGVTFLRVLLGRTLPLAWALRSQRPSQPALAAATVEVEESRDEVVVRLQGPWTGDNVGPVRDAFVRVASADRDIRVDLASAASADPELLGLLVLLYGHQRQQRRGFRCNPVSPAVLRIVRRSCVEFLLDDSSAR